MRENGAPLPPGDIASGLDEISYNLEQMLTLARLSASDLDLDRDALQKTLERLRARIDQIADYLGSDQAAGQ